MTPLLEPNVVPYPATLAGVNPGHLPEVSGWFVASRDIASVNAIQKKRNAYASRLDVRRMGDGFFCFSSRTASLITYTQSSPVRFCSCQHFAMREGDVCEHLMAIDRMEAGEPMRTPDVTLAHHQEHCVSRGDPVSFSLSRGASLTALSNAALSANAISCLVERVALDPETSPADWRFLFERTTWPARAFLACFHAQAVRAPSVRRLILGSSYGGVGLLRAFAAMRTREEVREGFGLLRDRRWPGAMYAALMLHHPDAERIRGAIQATDLLPLLRFNDADVREIAARALPLLQTAEFAPWPHAQRPPAS